MKRKTRKTMSAAGGFALALAAVIGGAGSPSARAQSAAATKPAEQVFKNIQVLKGIPADQVNPIMQFMAGSLGINCGFCHDDDNQKRHLDVKETKQTARKMIQMVFDLNRTAFGGKNTLSCYTCHRGSTKPTSPAVPEPVAAKEAATSSMPTADQILDKYVAALGGADALQKISSRVGKGIITDYDQGLPNQQINKIPVEIYAKVPDQRLAVAHLSNADTTLAASGSTGWLVFSGARLYSTAGRIYTPPDTADQTREMIGEELETARLEDTLSLARRVKQLVSQLRVEGVEKVGGQEAYVVSGRTARLPLVKLYFDKNSGLLVRLVHHTTTPFGFIPHQIDYADYRTVDGVKAPFRWNVADFRFRRFAYQMDDVRQNVPLEDSEFGKPSPPPAAR